MALAPVPFSPDQFIEVALSLCDSLDDLHSNSIIHCALSPSSILYNEKTNEVKLFDLTHARLINGLGTMNSDELVYCNRN